MSSSTWAAFREYARRSPEVERYEPLDASTYHSLEIFAPEESPQALLFFTKPFLCKLWWNMGAYPETLFAMVRSGVPTVPGWRLIRDTARRVRLPLCYIGDLDPFDLTIFLALRSGDPDIRNPVREALPIHYLGVDDAWLKLCQRQLLPKMNGYVPYFKMSALELEHRDVLLKMAPWVLDLVGPKCAEMVRSGLKFELEGAANPSFYKEGFSLLLRNHLLRRARTTQARAQRR